MQILKAQLCAQDCAEEKLLKMPLIECAIAKINEDLRILNKSETVPPHSEAEKSGLNKVKSLINIFKPICYYIYCV